MLLARQSANAWRRDRNYKELPPYGSYTDHITSIVLLALNTGGSTTRAVDFAVARLRKKIEPSPHAPRFLRTVHGDGYSLTFELPPEK